MSTADGRAGPTRSRAATEETSGARRDRERPPAPEPLPHPVVDNHCHLDIADGDWLDTADAIAAAVCRELTKTHEEVRRGPLAELVAWAGEGVRGEVTIVVSGAGPVSVATDPGSLRDAVADLEAAGESRKDAIKTVAARAGAPKRAVSDAVHEIGPNP